MNGRLNLTTPEASEAGAIVTILFVPFLLSSILTGYSSFKSKFLGKISYELILFLITMPIIFFTLSSSIYICVVLQIIAFLIIFYNKKIVFIAKYLVTFVIVILVICAISFVNFKSGTFNDIGFYISKITDLGVTSTSTRFGVIVAALKVFMKYPLNGTGHTNISIFMINNLPDWSFNSEIVSYINQGKDFTGPRVIRTIASNGIIGIVLCVLFIKNMYKRLKQYTDIEGKYMYNSFTFFLIASIVQGINSSDFKFMYLWVVFALFISATEKKVIT